MTTNRHGEIVVAMHDDACEHTGENVEPQRPAPAPTYREDMRRIGEALGLAESASDVGHILGQIDTWREERETADAQPTMAAVLACLARVVDFHDGWHEEDCGAASYGVDASLPDDPSPADPDCDCGAVAIRQEARVLQVRCRERDPLEAAAAEADKIREELGIEKLEREAAARNACPSGSQHGLRCVLSAGHGRRHWAGGEYYWYDPAIAPSGDTPSKASCDPSLADGPDADRMREVMFRHLPTVRAQMLYDLVAVVLDVRRETIEECIRAADSGAQECITGCHLRLQELRQDLLFTSPAKEKP